MQLEAQDQIEEVFLMNRERKWFRIAKLKIEVVSTVKADFIPNLYLMTLKYLKAMDKLKRGMK